MSPSGINVGVVDASSYSYVGGGGSSSSMMYSPSVALPAGGVVSSSTTVTAAPSSSSLVSGGSESGIPASEMASVATTLTTSTATHHSILRPGMAADPSSFNVELSLLPPPPNPNEIPVLQSSNRGDGGAGETFRVVVLGSGKGSSSGCTYSLVEFTNRVSL